jgi:hypothetical protein
VRVQNARDDEDDLHFRKLCDLYYRFVVVSIMDTIA